jgi:hypothetical protein
MSIFIGAEAAAAISFMLVLLTVFLSSKVVKRTTVWVNFCLTCAYRAAASSMQFCAKSYVRACLLTLIPSYAVVTFDCRHSLICCALSVPFIDLHNDDLCAAAAVLRFGTIPL